jgi:probable phosphoglycerate mutase
MGAESELVLARHGEAVCNVAGVLGGPRSCMGLTDVGRAQVERLAARLSAEHAARAFEALYASPRRRVTETAEILASALGLPVTVKPELRGPDHGSGDGQSWRQVEDAFGGPPQFDPDRAYAKGSDTWNGYMRRATAALALVLRQHPGGRVLVVGHGETIEAAHTLFLGLDPAASQRVRFVTDHACLVRWRHTVDRYGNGTWVLVAHNDIRHLG